MCRVWPVGQPDKRALTALWSTHHKINGPHVVFVPITFLHLYITNYHPYMDVMLVTDATVVRLLQTCMHTAGGARGIIGLRCSSRVCFVFVCMCVYAAWRQLSLVLDKERRRVKFDAF